MAERLPATEVPALDMDGNSIEATPDSQDLLAVAPSLVTPFEDIRRLHFLSEEDMKKMERRPFRNVRELSRSNISVTSSIRGKTNLNIEVLQSWLTDLDESIGPSLQDFVDVDKTAGAVALMAYIDPGLRGEVLQLMNGKVRNGDSRVPTWIRALGTGRSAGAEEDHYEDKLTFDAVSSALREKSPKTLQPRQTLAEIKDELLQRSELSEEKRNNLVEIIQRIESILANEIPFEGVKNENYPALQGLMFFLIRTKPDSLLKWSPEVTGSTKEAHLTSAAYCGLLYGHASLPLKFRSEDLDREIAKQTSDRLSPFSNLPRVGRDQSEIGVDRIEQLIESLLSEDLDSDSPLREIALNLCKEMGWADCVETVIFSRDRRPVQTYVTKEGGDNRKLKMAWRLPGMVDVNYEIDVEHFRKRIEQEELPRNLLEEMLNHHWQD
jgi:hypothetical protein